MNIWSEKHWIGQIFSAETHYKYLNHIIHQVKVLIHQVLLKGGFFQSKFEPK